MKGIIMFNDKYEIGKTAAQAVVGGLISIASMVAGLAITNKMTEALDKKKLAKLRKEQAVDTDEEVVEDKQTEEE